MLVYGDQEEPAAVSAKLRAIREDLARVWEMAPGLERHSALVSTLIEGGRLQQGIADACFDGLDRRSRAGQALGGFVHRLAKAVVLSWDSEGADVGALPEVPDLAGPPVEAMLRLPEGFAFYAVYPEAFIDAARALTLTAPARVIGIRSVGTTLGAVVSAALGAPPPVTVRPFGDPWARQVALSGELEAATLEGPAHYVIVDEGPGLSGSSFGSVIDWLRERGVPLDRIAVLPSHLGAPGPSASKAHRDQWRQVQRVPADLASRLPDLLEQRLADVLGPLDGPVIDLAAGRWRRWAFAGESQWPPVDAALERRKYLAFANGENWLVKFAGLGAEGARKAEIGRRLSQARLTPETRALVHGFLVERWHGDAVREQPPVDVVARYIGARARALRDCGGAGASLRELLEMAEQNYGEAGLEAPIARWRDRVAALEPRVRRIATDNRMMWWEWLRLPSGEWLKSDALDHHRAHDLVGCQDMAWDVAGAIVEMSLDAGQAEQLCSRVERFASVAPDPELLRFYLLAYPAFCIGQIHFADRASGGAEKRRVAARAEQLVRSFHRLAAARESSESAINSLSGTNRRGNNPDY